MHILSEKEFKFNAQPMMQKVFWEDREWSILFNEEVDSKRILFPFDLYMHDKFPKKFLTALVEAASSIGDEACYLSELYTALGERKHAYILLSELVEGFTAPPNSEKLIGATLDIDYQEYFIVYSEHGKWGFFHSFEHFGFLGGSSYFIRAIDSKMPDIETQVYDFLQYIKGENTNREITAQSRPRVRYLLDHMYDSLKAERLLQETGWY